MSENTLDELNVEILRNKLYKVTVPPRTVFSLVVTHATARVLPWR